jgi:uncharacterized membrane-anchored protein YhcB (DUF1043 family)
MTKTAWIVIGVGVAVGLTALLIWRANDQEGIKKKTEEQLKLFKAEMDKKK